MHDISALIEFLPCRTPLAWLEDARSHPVEMLVDHAHCEKKAASTAINLMYRYMEHPKLLQKMSKLAREELRHFEQVLKILTARGIAYGYLSSARYAGGLRELVRTSEPGKLIDTLIVGAFIEARSCERFAALLPQLDDELATFYGSLLQSESRHFRDYLSLAQEIAGCDISDRIAVFRAREQELIESPDTEFRFHSGPRIAQAS